MKIVGYAAALLLGLAGSAHASIAQVSTLPPGPYTSPIPTSITPIGSTTAVLTNQSGSIANVERSPFEGTGSPLGLYTSIEGIGSAVFNLSGNVLSLIWGSPDSYNRLSLFSGANASGTELATISGSQISPFNGSGFSYVTLSDFGTFGSIRLSNDPGQNAFEVSTFSVSPVPLPASLPMFGAALVGLGLLGFTMKKKASRVIPAAA